MDGSHFDAWTRSVVASSSRRTAVKALAGGALTGALAILSGRGAAAGSCGGKRDICIHTSDCCEGLTCDNGKCQYRQNCGGKKGDYCKKNKDCCDGYRCNKKDECERCGTKGDNCDRDKDCCPGFTCNSNGECKG